MDVSLLSKYRISYPESYLASSTHGAVLAARRMGFPVAMKMISPAVLHKSDKGGVMLGIQSPAEAEQAHRLLMERYRGVKVEGVLVQKMAGKGGIELIIGGARDAQFGQLLMLGTGGIFVEVFRDVTFRVCPINENDARTMIRELRSYPILAGARGRKPINESALVSTLLSVSTLLLKENPKEFDINPLIADSSGCTAVDMRLIK